MSQTDSSISPAPCHRADSTAVARTCSSTTRATSLCATGEVDSSRAWTVKSLAAVRTSTSSSPAHVRPGRPAQPPPWGAAPRRDRRTFRPPAPVARTGRDATAPGHRLRRVHSQGRPDRLGSAERIGPVGCTATAPPPGGVAVTGKSEGDVARLRRYGRHDLRQGHLIGAVSVPAPCGLRFPQRAGDQTHLEDGRIARSRETLRRSASTMVDITEVRIKGASSDRGLAMHRPCGGVVVFQAKVVVVLGRHERIGQHLDKALLARVLARTRRTRWPWVSPRPLAACGSTDGSGHSRVAGQPPRRSQARYSDRAPGGRQHGQHRGTRP